jgi:hypothetical protein
MRLVTFEVAGGGGRKVHVNPEHVVCIVDGGHRRSQIVTTGLSGHDSMSLIVEGEPASVARQLEGGVAVAVAA